MVELPHLPAPDHLAQSRPPTERPGQVTSPIRQVSHGAGGVAPARPHQCHPKELSDGEEEGHCFAGEIRRAGVARRGTAMMITCPASTHVCRYSQMITSTAHARPRGDPVATSAATRGLAGRQQAVTAPVQTTALCFTPSGERMATTPTSRPCQVGAARPSHDAKPETVRREGRPCQPRLRQQAFGRNGWGQLVQLECEFPLFPLFLVILRTYS